MTRTAKICGAVMGALVIYLLLGSAVRFNSGEAYAAADHRPAHAATNVPSSPPLHLLPNVFFWAWERPEDLQFVNARVAGVAFLAKTIYLSPRYQSSTHTPSGHFAVRPRLQRLSVAPGTPLVAVVRLEASPRISPRSRETISRASDSVAHLAAAQPTEIAREIAELQLFPGVRAIQIDFDATVSQRAFYMSLLSDVRRNLPASFPLSITALASWCIGDSWLERLPPGTIDEAVPMLFRMGPDTAAVSRFLRSGQEFPVAACQGSLGLSTDESLSNKVLTRKLAGMPSSWRDKRVYVFSPRLWTPSAADFVLKEWER